MSNPFAASVVPDMSSFVSADRTAMLDGDLKNAATVESSQPVWGVPESGANYRLHLLLSLPFY